MGLRKQSYIRKHGFLLLPYKLYAVAAAASIWSGNVGRVGSDCPIWRWGWATAANKEGVHNGNGQMAVQAECG
jgi:hypothetical protein